MRTSWLGIVALLFTAGCLHEGKLHPQAGAVPLTEEGNAAVTGEQGVTLVAYGSNWKGQPRNLEQHFTLVEVRLENHSGRPLSVRYEGFELDGKRDYVARQPSDLGQLISTRSIRWRPARPIYNAQRGPQPSSSKGLPAEWDQTYSRNNGSPPYNPPPCHTCPSPLEAAQIPSPDMLRMALQEGPLESGQVRKGFLYFEEPLLTDDHVALKVKLVDASTGELFGALSIPFEVH